VTGEAVIDLDIGGSVFETAVLIVENGVVPLLGMDWLRFYGAKLNLGMEILEIGHTRVPLVCESTFESERHDHKDEGASAAEGVSASAPKLDPSSSDQRVVKRTPTAVSLVAGQRRAGGRGRHGPQSTY
jgi:hypothetical protein